MESVTKIIEEVAAEICDKYCRFPAEYAEKFGDGGEAFDRLCDEKCVHCPLNKLI